MSSVRYNHGVEVSSWGELRGAAEIREGMKPTVLFEKHVRQLTATVLKKNAELRFGAVDFDAYMNVVEETSKAGFTWYSELCTDTAVYLCCYQKCTMLFSGKGRLELFRDVALGEGDTLDASLDENGRLSFRVNGAVVVDQHPVGAAVSLAVQFFQVDDRVRLDLYRHGVEVQDRIVTARETAASELPTLVLSGPLALRVRRKSAKMMFGVVNLAEYTKVAEGGSRGHAWYSRECRDGVAVYLCCYPCGGKVYDGNNRRAAEDELVLSEGDVVTVDRPAEDATKLCFQVNGREITAGEASAPEECCFAIQFDAAGDSVELLTPEEVADSVVAPPAGSAVRQVPAVKDVYLPRQMQDCLPGDGFILRPVARTDKIFACIQNCFAVTQPAELHKGKDVGEEFPWYDGIRVAAVWQVISWRNNSYYHAYRSLKSKITKRGDLSPAAFPSKLDGHSDESLDLDDTVVEKLLLHGTKPEHVLSILNNGLNERFSKGVFGEGAYLAEDVEKMDQYVHMDASWQESGQPLHELHTRLYGHRSGHPRRCFYSFVCRAALGCSLHTKDGQVPLDGSCSSIWQVQKKELAVVPGSSPPEHFHSLVVELGESLKRFREFVLFHSERALPEFLVVYHRTAVGAVVPAG